jgi:hypothetical protein
VRQEIKPLNVTWQTEFVPKIKERILCDMQLERGPDKDWAEKTVNDIPGRLLGINS